MALKPPAYGRAPWRLSPPLLEDDPLPPRGPFLSPPQWPLPPSEFLSPRRQPLPGRAYLFPPRDFGWGSALRPAGAAQPPTYVHGTVGLRNWDPRWPTGAWSSRPPRA